MHKGGGGVYIACIIPLTDERRVELLMKLTARLGLGDDRKNAVVAECQRREYHALTQVPLTLTMLVHILSRHEFEEVLTIHELPNLGQNCDGIVGCPLITSRVKKNPNIE